MDALQAVLHARLSCPTKQRVLHTHISAALALLGVSVCVSASFKAAHR